MTSGHASRPILVLLLALAGMGCSGRADLPPPIVPLSPTENAAFRSSPPLISPPPTPTFPDVHAFALENGLCGYVVPLRGSPIVGVRYVTRRLRDADVNTTELADAAARLVVEPRVRRPFGLFYLVSNAGVVFSSDTTAEHLAGVLRTLRISLVSQKFDAEDFPGTRDLLRRWLRGLNTNAAFRANAESWRALFGPEYPLAATADERASRIERWTSAGFDDAFGRIFGPRDSAIVIAGDVDVDAAESAIRKEFGTWKDSGERPPQEIPTGAHRGKPVRVFDMPWNQVVVDAAALAPREGSKDQVPFQLLSYILAGSLDSRLAHALRESSGHGYTVRGHYDAVAGAWMFTTSVDPFAVQESVEALESELTRLLRDAPSPDELERARTESLEGLAARLEAPDTLATSLAELYMIGRGPERWAELDRLIRSATSADVARVARRYFGESRAIVTVVGPMSTIAAQLQWSKYPVEYVAGD